MLNVAQKHAASPQREPFLDCLRGVPLFSNLSDEELDCFHDAAYLQTYEKGDILYFKDESAEFFYVIYRGWIKLFHILPGGKEVIVDMLTAGHMVGESAIFEDSGHTSSAQVVEPVQLLRIPSKLLKEQMRLKPVLALGMLSSISRHHRRHYGRIALNAMQNAPQRIGCFLLRLCPADKKWDIMFRLPYDKTLIAETLGMDGATFSRALTMLKQEADVYISGSVVEVDSADRLAKFVYGLPATTYLSGERDPIMSTAEKDDFSESAIQLIH